MSPSKKKDKKQKTCERDCIRNVKGPRKTEGELDGEERQTERTEREGRWKQGEMEWKGGIDKRETVPINGAGG